jgi:hypothetical protein
VNRKALGDRYRDCTADSEPLIKPDKMCLLCLRSSAAISSWGPVILQECVSPRGHLRADLRAGTGTDGNNVAICADNSNSNMGGFSLPTLNLAPGVTTTTTRTVMISPHGVIFTRYYLLLQSHQSSTKASFSPPGQPSFNVG